MHNLHTRPDRHQGSRREDARALSQRLKEVVANIRRFQQYIDHFIPRPEVIPFVWQDEVNRR